MQSPNTLIIGAGAAGLSAACFCPEPVLVLDRMPSPGRKLLATGGGRCNLTHDCTPREMAAAFGRNARFAAPAIHHFSPERICAFFREGGVDTVIQSDGCVFPQSQKAADILQALLRRAKARDLRIMTSVEVQRLVAEPASGTSRRIVRVETSAGDFEPAHIILAAGGRSYPALGSDGSGFRLLEDLGLPLETPLPALAGLRTVESWPATLTGAVLGNASLSIAEESGSFKSVRGEVLFTHDGISAPAALDISGEVSFLLHVKNGGAADPRTQIRPVRVALNMDCSCSAERWLELFSEWRAQHGGRSLHNLLAGKFPRALARLLCHQAGLETCAAARASKERLRVLAGVLTASPLHVSGVDGWHKAMVTRGGLSTGALDPKTLVCRSVSNLQCIGEVVDVDGPCGGYNLTWAFASGALAAESVAALT